MSEKNSNPQARGRLSRWATEALHIFYNIYIIVTLSSVLYAFFGIEAAAKDIWIARTIYIAVATLLSLMLLFLLYFAISFSGKAKYAEIMPNLHEVQHQIRDLTSEIKKIQHSLSDTSAKIADKAIVRERIAGEFSRVLTQIVIAFSMSKGVNCRSSIKILGLLNPTKDISPGNMFVRTLARDQGSAHTCKEKDSLEKKDHLVSKNTDFALLVSDEQKYFFSNDIADEGNYLNSSKDHWSKASPILAKLKREYGLFVKRFSAYPYRSVMVFPIRGALLNTTNNMPIVGFLCIDSKSRSCFNERYDVDLGASFTDSLYHPIRAYVMLMASPHFNDQAGSQANAE